MMTVDFLVSSFVTLMVVVDPVSLAPIFNTLTRGLSAEEEKRIALRACFLAGAILCAVALGGDWLLAQRGITLPAFRVAGGSLLFAVAFDMVLGWRGERESREAEDAVHKDRAQHIAAFPLAIPLMAGPGAITATLLIAGRTDGRLTYLLMLLADIAAVVGVCLAAFLSAGPISRRLGTTANLVLSRLLGIILAALAVQYVIDGLRAVRWA